MIIVCIAGMPGSGKSIVAKAALDLGLNVYNMGDVVREETLKKYGEISPELLRRTSIELRRKFGAGIIAEKTLEKIRKSKDLGKECMIVVDGVRSLEEIDVFTKLGKVVILAVHASPKTRFKRILKRSRPGDPKTWEEFRKRDLTELSLGIGSVIALADYMIVNEGDVRETYKKAKEILEGIRSNVCKS